MTLEEALKGDVHFWCPSGQEYTELHQFTGIANLRKVINAQSTRLQQGISNQQYLSFRPVTEEDLAKIDNARDSIGKHLQMTHYTDTNMLIVKLMPSEEHESAHLTLGMKLILKVIAMGMTDEDLRPVSATRYRRNTSSKEGDTSYKPVLRPTKADWPTLIIESARWWLMNSNGH